MSESRTIPVSELGAPDEAAVSRLSAGDIFGILAAKVRRGRAICVALYVTGFIGFAVFLFYRSTTWAVATLIWSIAFKCGAMLSHQKLQLAYRISVEPQLVYWAHPRRSFVLGYACLLTLHSRTGQALEVATSREQALSVVAWLKRHNSDIRIGDYDNTPQNLHERNT